jgi:glycosyltransferase involved in cell wall biosynthesis
MYWRRILPATWRRCCLLTASNNAVADDIAEGLPFPRSRIHVVPYYPEPELAKIAQSISPGFLERCDEPGPKPPVFLTLASHEPRKNIELAIKAVGWLGERDLIARLVCIGGYSRHTARLKELAQRCRAAGRVDFVGYLGRAETVRHMLSCTALLFVSRYEGYGMPPQEAQSVGCPVVLSELPCHRQVYADPTRLERIPAPARLAPSFVEVDDFHALAQEMRRLIEDTQYRSRLRQAGLAYSETFSARATATALSRAFETASQLGL